jgi:hypothetical protein
VGISPSAFLASADFSAADCSELGFSELGFSESGFAAFASFASRRVCSERDTASNWLSPDFSFPGLEDPDALAASGDALFGRFCGRTICDMATSCRFCWKKSADF